MSNEKFEKSEGCNTHEILSDNVLCCSETGRVVAVFYNDYDLDKVVSKLDRLDAIYNFCKVES